MSLRTESTPEVRAPDDRGIFVGGGEIAKLLRGLDWTTSPLGPPETWPQSLQSIVRLMLTSKYQMWMGWGPELAYLYNDAYRPTLGVKHPLSLAQPVATVWKEIWSDIGPLIEKVLKTGEAHYGEGMLLLLERSGFREETYHTFSYSPLFDDGGSVAGLFCVVVEETERVINERRLATLRELASSFAGLHSELDIFAVVTAKLGENLKDLPFTLSYLIEDEGRSARLVAATGIEPGHPAAQMRLQSGSGPWPFEALLGSAPAILVEDLQKKFGGVPSGYWDKQPRDAILVPIAQQAHDKSAAGFMVVGLNPYRAGDGTLRGFINLLAGQIAAALATARAYEEERRRAAALAEIDRAKTVFFSNVSHEFRTPLTLMLGPLEDVLTQRPDLATAFAQVDLAHRNGLRLLRLVNNLLDFSRLEAGRVQAKFEKTDLAAFTIEIGSSFRSAIEKAGLRLTTEIQQLDLPAFVDRDMWEKVVLNLLSNAFKFTFEGEIALRVERGSDHTAVVRVSDTGVGIPDAEIPKLFDRFHRVEGARGRSYEGSGIGLSLVQELVKLHGGAIRVESKEGRGTSVEITLPLGSAHLAADRILDHGEARRTVSRAAAFVDEALRWLPQNSPSQPALSGGHVSPAEGLSLEPARHVSGSGKKVLLADDNTDMRDYVTRLLKDEGYTVEAVADGEAAMAAIHADPPDLILSDVMMPRLDGLGLLRAVRSQPPLAGIPVILLSARAGEEARVEGLAATADDYLVKPFSSRELIARVNANIQMALVRREAARALMSSEQRYHMTQERLSLALSTGRVSVFEWAVEEDRLVVQGPLSEAFGVPREAAERGLPLAAFVAGISPEDLEPTMVALNYSINNIAPYQAEYRLASSERVVLARGEVQVDSGGRKRMSGVVIDVTQEKAAEAALHALNATLEERIRNALVQQAKTEETLRQAQKMEAVGQLTGGVAHDFNNLLTIIIGGLDTISRCEPNETQRLRRAASMALQGAQRATSLTKRLLAFSRRQPLDPKPMELNIAVRDMTDLLHRTLGEQIELEGVLSPRLWLTEVDQNQFESAIINLAVNARDAMPDGGKLTIETSNAALDEAYASTDAEVIPGQYVLIAVSDTGSGMSKEILARVFEPFYTTKEVGKGTGLGLSMVYGFVKQSGGHVTIYSEEGQGTTVKLYFPRFMGGQLVDATPVPGRAPRGNETILVVEDNEDVRAYSVMILEELGYQVLQASEFDSAMAVLNGKEKIDLLFTDVVLPGKSGRLIADAATALRPTLKVLFTTGYSRNAIVHHGRLDPGVHLISKPFTFEELSNRVRDLLDRRSPALR